MTKERAKNQQTFEKDISALRRRLEAIANHTRLSDKARLDILLHDLSVSLEELEVTHEELLAANEEMEETRRQVESERQRYLDLFEGAPDGYVVTDANGMIVEANIAAASMLNTRDDFLTGKPLVLFVTDEGKKEFHSRVIRLSSGERRDVREWELALQPRDRAPVPVLVSVSAVREAEGTATRLRWLLRDITERNAAREALQFQKNLLEERVKELHCLFDIARIIERGAPLGETLQGIAEQIPPGWQYPHSACARIHAGDIECATPNFVESRWKLEKEIYARGQPVGTVDVCYRSAKPDADEGPFLTEERHLLEIIAVRIGNVIERAWAEEALQESNARNQLLVENLSEGIWFVDEDAVTTFVNEQMADMLGYRVEEMNGRPLQDFLPGKGGEEIAGYMERRRQGIREKIEQTFLHKDGSRICTLMITSPIWDETGGFAGAIAGISDITERKRTEEQLAYQAAVFSNMQDAVIGTDTSYRITLWNPAAEQFYGWNADEVKGRSIQEVVRSEFSDEQTTEALRILHENGELRLEVRQYRRDGTPLEVEGVTISLYGDNGQVAGYLSVNRDITERKRAEEALRETNRKLNLLSSITRHDILNQVTALKAFLLLVEERQLEDPEAVEMFSKLKMIADTIRRQITFTGDYQHMGEQDPQWQQVTYVMKRAAESVMLKGATLTVTTGALEVFADPMLEKAFYNLLDNAVVHGGDVTAIDVSCRKKGKNCVIVVEDDGTGIPAAMKEAIFQRGVGRITGYGLFLTKEILAITGMTIQETGEEGEGTRFEITVPGDGWRTESGLS